MQIVIGYNSSEWESHETVGYSRIFLKLPLLRSSPVPLNGIKVLFLFLAVSLVRFVLPEAY